MGILRNRFWVWNRYNNELTLRPPLSIFVVFMAGIGILSAIAGFVNTVL